MSNPTSSSSYSNVSFSPFVSSSPGKLILSGEHAVVHGIQALAAVIDKRTIIQFTSKKIDKTHSHSDTNTDTIELVIDHQQQPLRFSWNRNQIDDLFFHRHQQNQRWDPDTQSIPDPSPHFIQTLRELVARSPDTRESCAAVFLLYYYGLIAPRTVMEKSRGIGFTCTVQTELPMSSGLGSSASFCSSLAAGFLHLRSILTQPNQPQTPASSPSFLSGSSYSIPLSLINSWSFEGECLIHGTPSGVDNTCSVYGGLVLYRKGHPFVLLPSSSIPLIRLMIVNTKQERNTKKLVEGVKELKERLPQVVGCILDAIENIGDEWLKMLGHNKQTEEENGNHIAASASASAPGSSGKDGGIPSLDLHIASDLFRANHHLLNSLGVGHPRLDAVCALTASYGFATKLTGAGGGGCAITLLKDDSSDEDKKKKEEIKRRLVEELGCEILECVIGREGVSLKENTELKDLIIQAK